MLIHYLCKSEMSSQSRGSLALHLRETTTPSTPSYSTVDNTSSIHQVASEYRNKLDADDLNLILQIADSKGFLTSLEEELKASDKQKNRLSTFADGVQRYSWFVSLLGAASPELGFLFWGSMDLLQKACCGADTLN